MCYFYVELSGKKLSLFYITVSMCGTGWYGNVFVNKCYRYIPQAMTFTFARDTCMQEGGRLAVVDSNFLRRFILTSVTLARYTSNIQSMFMIKIDTGGI